MFYDPLKTWITFDVLEFQIKTFPFDLTSSSTKVHLRWWRGYEICWLLLILLSVTLVSWVFETSSISNSTVRDVKQGTNYRDLQCSPISVGDTYLKGIHFTPTMAVQSSDEWSAARVIALEGQNTPNILRTPSLLAV